MSATEPLATAAEHLMAAKMFSLASCVMLFYDMTITFGDEVEKIWKQRFTGATLLWFMNRYISPLGYIVIIVSFHDPWPKSVCQRYVQYPEILKIFTSTAIGVVFILRLYSIYSRNRVILVAFSIFLLFELSVKIWAFTDGTMLQLPPQLIGCILTGRSDSSKRIVYTWVAELVFDTLVFLATLFRTLVLYRTSGLGTSSSLIRIIMRDGVIYFAAIFVSNLVTVLMFVAAPPDLKVINASFSTLITSLMVSRLMLNLRQEALRRSPVRFSAHMGGLSSHAGISTGGRPVLTSMGSWTSVGKNHTGMEITMSRTLEQTIIGNLGAPVEGWYDDDSDLEETEGAKRDMEEDEDQEGMAEFGEGGLEMKGMGVTQKQHTGRSRRQIAVEVTQEVIVRHDSVGEDGRSEIDIESRKGGRSFAPAVDSDRPGL